MSGDYGDRSGQLQFKSCKHEWREGVIEGKLQFRYGGCYRGKTAISVRMVL
jgi:hypothetical protein